MSEESTLHPSGARAAQRDDGPREPGLLLLFTGGNPTARTLTIDGRDGLEVGRGDLCFGEHPDRRMSRRHARVRHDGRRFTVEDLGSQNGTAVDGVALPPGEARPVERVIRMGDSLFIPCADIRPFERLGVKILDGHVRGPTFQLLLGEVARLAQIGGVLHIHGESGSGKEGIARAFHLAGPTRQGPFVAVNCATLQQTLAERQLFGAKKGAFSGADADAIGHLQAADGGTLFLDEVVDLDLAVQGKLLRVLETKEVVPLGAARGRRVELQICSATNKDMRALVAAGKMRDDLYFRIGRPEVAVPPLRSRPEEIAWLVGDELRRVAPQLVLHPSLLEAALLRPWPGNVRELLVEVRAAVQVALAEGAGRLESRHLAARAGTAFGPGALSSSSGGGRETTPLQRLRTPEQESELRGRIEEALARHQGNVAAAARALGLHRTQLRRYIERLGLRAAPPSAEDPDDGGQEG